VAAAVAFPLSDHSEPRAAGWQAIQDVPCWLTAEIPVSGFTVRDLLLLQPESVVNSKQSTRGKVALLANGSLIARAEFEVINNRLGVRFTELE
jgi:flagellar motor switch/type III secretory pathway protein FliN